MTLEEACEHIGDKVLYHVPDSVRTDEGVITSVNDHYAFVRYGAEYASKATPPWRLELLSKP